MQDLTWATVDLDDPAQMREPEAKLVQQREEKLQMNLRRVRTLGIIGDYGNRLSKTLPPDLREGDRYLL